MKLLITGILTVLISISAKAYLPGMPGMAENPFQQSVAEIFQNNSNNDTLTNFNIATRCAAIFEMTLQITQTNPNLQSDSIQRLNIFWTKRAIYYREKVTEIKVGNWEIFQENYIFPLVKRYQDMASEASLLNNGNMMIGMTGGDPKTCTGDALLTHEKANGARKM
jgi:hypothetical protein